MAGVLAPQLRVVASEVECRMRRLVACFLMNRAQKEILFAVLHTGG